MSVKTVISSVDGVTGVNVQPIKLFFFFLIWSIKFEEMIVIVNHKELDLYNFLTVLSVKDTLKIKTHDVH